MTTTTPEPIDPDEPTTTDTGVPEDAEVDQDAADSDQE